MSSVMSNDRKRSQESMLKAVEKGFGLREAARMFGVPVETLIEKENKGTWAKANLKQS